MNKFEEKKGQTYYSGRNSNFMNSSIEVLKKPYFSKAEDKQIEQSLFKNKEKIMKANLRK